MGSPARLQIVVLYVCWVLSDTFFFVIGLVTYYWYCLCTLSISLLLHKVLIMVQMLRHQMKTMKRKANIQSFGMSSGNQ